jgi:Carboxypeptidase regulatory-like domain/TonB dependent receptor/TonB-dependent Receptor Plug Domain
MTRCHPLPFALRSLLLVALCGLPFAVAHAQSNTATLSGTVTDANGAVVLGVTVTVTDPATRLQRTAMTNDAGKFVVPVLPPSTYNVTLQLDGFLTAAIDDLVLNVGDVRSLRIQLKVGDVNETVTVTDETPLINDSPAVSTVVDRQFVENMPLNGRSFQSLIALAPGVTFTPAFGSTPGQFSVNGQRTNSNYFTVDGVSANVGTSTLSTMGETVSGSTPGWSITGGTNGLVSVDAMQEFRIQTSTYAPEFGRSPGGQISVATRSGTNEYHGNAFDYLRNEIFDARDFFNMKPAAKPPLRQNNFGGTFGGPLPLPHFGEGGPAIRSGKDKTFFFFSYEGLRLRQPQTATGHFYTAAARVLCPLSGPLPALCVSAAWKPIVDADPLPNGPVDANGRTALLTASYSLPTTQDSTSVRIDSNVTRNINFFVRYNHAPSNGVTRNFAQVRKNVTNIDTVTGGVTFAISSNMVNDFRANWSRSTGQGDQYNDNFMGAAPPPNSAVFGPYDPATTQTFLFYLSDSSGGYRLGLQADNVQRQLNFVDTLSLTKGTHQLKFGVDWRRLTPTASFVPVSINMSASSYANLQNGTVGNVNVDATGNKSSLLINNYSMFVQDTWSATKKLTLTYGLRWEINPAPSDTDKPIYSLAGVFDANPRELVTTPVYKTQLNAFAPRIGAAYQVTPKTVVRGGFGLFYDLGVSSQVASAVTGQYPWNRFGTGASGISLDFNNPLFPTPLPFPNPLTPPNGTFAQVMAVDPNLSLPVTYQWNAAVEQELGANQSLTVTYVGAKGRKLLRQETITPRAPTPWSSIFVVRNADRSDYNALQAQFQRRMSRGLQVIASYTYAKSTDTASSDGRVGVGAQTLEQLSTGPDLNLGYSDFDVRHTYSGAVSYQLPAPKWTKVGNALLKGWAVDALVRGRSGYPFTVTSFTRIVVNGVSQRVRADVVPGQQFWIYDSSPGGRRVNPAAFAQPANNLPGNQVRNSLRDFSASQTDVALRRRFGLTERVKLDLRVEYFNVFNHPMFTLATNFNFFNRPGFGIASQTLGSAFSGGGTGGGQSALYNMGSNRSGQLTLKLSF